MGKYDIAEATSYVKKVWENQTWRNRLMFLCGTAQFTNVLQTAAFKKVGAEQQDTIDLAAADAVQQSLERHLLSYAHMVGTCPMGSVLDADCRVRGIDGLRVADGSVMPTIPSGNTYLGCVMVAERIAEKMKHSLR